MDDLCTGIPNARETGKNEDGRAMMKIEWDGQDEG